MSLAEICENAKMAREYALLGNYDTSLVYYQGVVQQIQKHIQQIKDDAVMKQEWHQVCNDHGRSAYLRFLDFSMTSDSKVIKTNKRMLIKMI